MVQLPSEVSYLRGKRNHSSKLFQPFSRGAEPYVDSTVTCLLNLLDVSEAMNRNTNSCRSSLNLANFEMHCQKVELLVPFLRPPTLLSRSISMKVTLPLTLVVAIVHQAAGWRKTWKTSDLEVGKGDSNQDDSTQGELQWNHSIDLELLTEAGEVCRRTRCIRLEFRLSR